MAARGDGLKNVGLVILLVAACALPFAVSGFRVFQCTQVAIYAIAGFTGYRSMSAEREKIDPTVRSSPGGYRSFHFWHTGFAGGKT